MTDDMWNPAAAGEVPPVAPDPKPVPKVAAAGMSGAAASVLIWIVGLLGLDMPAEVAAAIATLAAFAAGYLKSNGVRA